MERINRSIDKKENKLQQQLKKTITPSPLLTD